MSKWEMVRLGDVCEKITDGTHQTPTYSNEGFIFLSSKNVTTGKIDWTNVKFIPEDLHVELHKRLSPQKNDILLAKNGTTGTAAIVDRDCIFDIYVSLALLRPKNVILACYLLHAINNPFTKRKFNKELKGIGVPNLHLTSIREVTIPLPPLEAQKHIAKTLDAASEVITLHKKQLSELDSLIKSIFYDMFGDPVVNDMGWEVRKLGKLSLLITKGSSPNWQGINYIDDNNQVLFITSENVREGYLDLSKKKYLEDKFNTVQSRSILQKNDVLINIVGASIGRACVFDLDIKANINQAVALVRCKNMINLDYLNHYLNSPKAIQMYASLQVEVARANLSLKNIGDLNILIPPLPLQQKFANIVTKIEEQKDIVKKAIDESQYLFDSLMSEYFE